MNDQLLLFPLVSSTVTVAFVPLQTVALSIVIFASGFGLTVAVAVGLVANVDVHPFDVTLTNS